MTVATLIYQNVYAYWICRKWSDLTALFLAHLSDDGHESKNVVPRRQPALKRIRRKLVQSNEWTLHCKRYIRARVLQNIQFVRVQKFSACSSAVHEILIHLRVSGFICWVDSWKEGLRSQRQRVQSSSFSVGASTSQLPRSLTCPIFIPRIES